MFGGLKQDRLSTVTAPTKVKLRGAVRAVAPATSPMTEMKAAIFLLTVGARWTEIVQYGDVEEVVERYQEIDSMVVGRSLILQTEEGKVLVPRRDLELVFPERPGIKDVHLVSKPLPPGLMGAMSHPRMSGASACFGETSLSNGDQVLLEATVAPLSEAEQREQNVDAQWTARPDLGPVKLHDESMAQFRRGFPIGWVIGITLTVLGVLIWLMR